MNTGDEQLTRKQLQLYQQLKCFCLMSSYFTNSFLQVMEKEIKQEEMKEEKRSKDDRD